MEPDLNAKSAYRELHISIHGLRMEPDNLCHNHSTLSITFQSTGSVWSPTAYREPYEPAIRISIHGLRMEPDFCNFIFGFLNLISIHGLRMEPDLMI